MLDQSAAELRLTVDELEKRYDTIENEGKQVSTQQTHSLSSNNFNWITMLQGLHRLEKYLNIQDCLEKSLKIKFALKNTQRP